MGFGAAHPPNVGKRPAPSRMVQARQSKAVSKKNKNTSGVSTGVVLKPLGRDKKKQRIVQKRIDHAKRNLEEKAKAKSLPKGVKASDVAMLVEDK